MNKFLSILVAGLFATSLSFSAFAADAVKPVVAETAKPAADTKAKTTIAAKKDSGIKTAVKKLAPSAKKTELKIK